MNRLFGAIILLIFPFLVLADSGHALSFAPPASDYSVVFLGNLFGVVDGVLHGTGSQIMGAMFSVFNSAVLALGGMIITYTLLVSTMNTAHEGQMLGQKWSSVWIPLRSTIGLALLIPKNSGYCLMQIFVMWISVQGIGAADKVWEAALGYLNRGGVIIQAQSNPGEALLSKNNAQAIPTGALVILQGEICMLGLQNQLTSQRQAYLDNASTTGSQCNTSSPNYSDYAAFCTTAVPDFVSTINTVTAQNDAMNGTSSNYGPAAGPYFVKMPNFTDSTSPYYYLNGICGTVQWNSPTNLTGDLGQQAQTGTSYQVNGIELTSSQYQTTQLSRAIAIQQMFVDMYSVAQIMVNNDPQLNNSTTDNSDSSDTTDVPYSAIAQSQFGVPYNANSTTCSSGNQCTSWGALYDSGSNYGSSAVLFNGTEFLGAVSDYNGIMLPTLNLIQESNDAKNANQSREFINTANTQGWIMAGSYFFDLVRLNGNAASSTSSLIDTSSGLESSSFTTTNLTNPCSSPYAQICTWFGGSSTMIEQVAYLIEGSNQTIGQSGSEGQYTGGLVNPPNFNDTTTLTAYSSQASSTANGFVNDSIMVQQAGQPGLAPMNFANQMSFTVDSSPYYLKSQNFGCGRVKIVFFSFCLGQMFGDLFYNNIFRYMYNFFLALFEQIIKQVIFAFLMIPLQGMSQIFKDGLTIISTPGVNPVVALAHMGANYINFAGNLWIELLIISVTSSLLPIFGIFIFALIALALPMILAWLSVMVSVGFITAYYVPILPYMIFTFGSIAWLICIIEAMVAAPIVALGVTHPEGHDAFGKGEAAIMILLNVFLRPSMMIIGYIAAIALCYVGVWILNAGFDHAISFVQSGSSNSAGAMGWDSGQTNAYSVDNSLPSGGGSGGGGYTEWAGIYAYFFSILIYTSMYLTIVQKSFTLITYLPDKVLRWIGGNPETLGQEASQWGDEVKGQVKDAGDKTKDAQAQMGSKLEAGGQKAIGGLKEGFGKMMDGNSGSAKSSGSSSAPSSSSAQPPGGGGGGGAPPAVPS